MTIKSPAFMEMIGHTVRNYASGERALASRLAFHLFSGLRAGAVVKPVAEFKLDSFA